MKNEHVQKILISIYNSLQGLEVKATSVNIKILLGVYLEIEKTLKGIQEDRGDDVNAYQTPKIG